MQVHGKLTSTESEKRHNTVIRMPTKCIHPVSLIRMCIFLLSFVLYV